MTNRRQPPHPRHVRLAQRLIDAASSNAWPPGHHLAEEECARLLDVSRTPARAALRLLEELGVVNSRPGRGFVLLRTGTDLAGVAPAAPEPAEMQVRSALIRDRLAGRLGALQSQVDLVRRYHVGLPTLQRILSRMEEEGLVSREGWQWSFTPTLDSRASRRASYELRLVLEPASLLMPGFAIDPEVLHLLDSQHAAFLKEDDEAAWDPMRIFDLDARFHEALAAFSRNPFVRTIVRQQNALRRFLEVGSYDDRSRVRAWCEEHRSIIKALEEGRPAEASASLRGHLLRAAEAADSIHETDEGA